jgi:nicotinamide-nucleotide amidase
MSETEAATAFIVSQGEELLTGQTLDTNAHFLCEQLTALGLRVLGAATAGDRTDDIADVLARASAHAQVVICTGGLGPTLDDLTAEAVAAAFGVDVVLNELALAQVEERYRRAKRAMASSNRRQAMLPAGCTVLENDVGTAPGFAVETRLGRLYCLPGVPYEMKRMWADRVLPDLRERLALVAPQRRLFRVLGRGESQLQDLLCEVPERFPGLELGFRTRMPENQVKLVAEPDVPGMDEASAWIREQLGRDLFSEDPDEELAGAVGRLLQARGETLALAESCTGGWVGHLVVSEPGSSRWFERGWITYSNRAKEQDLDVPTALLEEHGAVSEEVALAMAQGARSRSGAQWAVSITGVAGPTGGTAEKPVGTVCFGIVGPGVSRTRRLNLPARGRTPTRRFSAYLALDMLRRQILRADTATGRS